MSRRIDVSAAAYDKVTGVITITTSTNHNLSVGMGVTISGLEFNCGGATNATFPSGKYGYVFDVLAVNSDTEFMYMLEHLSYLTHIKVEEQLKLMFKDLLMVK